MRNERSITVVFPVFGNYSIEIVVAKDATKARKERDDVYGAFEGPFYALHSFNKEGNALLVFPQGVKIGTIAHECFHAVIAMMDWIGNDASNECAAYHTGYLTQKVYDFVRSRSKR
jgi:hypothetical protein